MSSLLHPSSLNDIRNTFLSFFEHKEHALVRSSSLIPQNDPTLLFTNSGMVQFKDVFTQNEKRTYTKATTSQRCLRAGGKHNDLSNVGYTARHHTFFEMLGNFSFGDYFKEEAILYAWELLTRVFNVPENRLLVTVYHNDDEAFNLWRRIAGLSEERIIRIATSDNFWSMGDSGPCGPCSEIFYDHGDSFFGGPPGSKDEDGDRFIEIWNLVFMQFNQDKTGSRSLLPKPSIDTGMGLERIAAVLQGVHNNYDIDLFKKIMDTSQNLSKTPGDQHITSHRVLADHLRACCFLIADGILPSNEGRGYVLRRIIRRAIRHVNLLNVKDPFFYRLVPTLVEFMGSMYPELPRAQSLIEETLKGEEERFSDTLAKGLKILNEELSHSKNGVFSGASAFKLYDTYGFPLDLTQDILKSHGVQVNNDEFEHEMNIQRQRAKASWQGSGEKVHSDIWMRLKSLYGSTKFSGYEKIKDDCSIQSLLNESLEEIPFLREGDRGYVIVNQTPFYGESGGQEGDIGFIISGRSQAEVYKTSKEIQSIIVHHVIVDVGELYKCDPVELLVGVDHRAGLKIHHSATHLLHAALRIVLGDHVVQKGSLVSSTHLRFDFTHQKPLSHEELQSVENHVNEQILENQTTHTDSMSYDHALDKGAMALFGEKYEDQVRVVSLGEKEGDPSHPFSIELCGGTHVSSLGSIGLFKIIHQTGVASGVRRIEAVCGMAFVHFIRNQEEQFKQEKEHLKAQILALQKDLKVEQKKNATNSTSVNSFQAKNISCFALHEKGVDLSLLRDRLDDLKKKYGRGVYILSCENETKFSFILASHDIENVDCSALVQTLSSQFNGRGGGKKSLAQGGGRINKLC